jgi:mono/diheme cytochrome c family protein
MKNLFKWLVRVIGVLMLAVVGAVAYIFVVSERAREQAYNVPVTSFTAARDPAAVENGRRQAIIHGCTSCHGPQLSGLTMLDDPKVARIRSPNITVIVRQYSDAELARLLRKGVKRNGRGLWVMPASPHLSDEDLGAIIAYLRTVPQQPGDAGEVTMGPLARLGVATGKMGDSVKLEPTPSTALDRTDPISLGRYLVKSACTECHGSRLEGSEFVKSPNLLVSAGYQDEDFIRLMRTGIGMGNRDLGKMTAMGRDRFSSLTDEEVRAIRAYLQEFVRLGGQSMP